MTTAPKKASKKNQTNQIAQTNVGEELVVLSNISWTTYEHLLSDLECQSAPRLTYDQGVLQVMSPGPLHERVSYVLERLIDCYAQEKNIEVFCFGSATFKKELFGRGFEPDTCFYIEKPAINAVIGQLTKIDLSVVPPPDLIVEVDISNSSIDKFAIFADMVVPEVWRYGGDRLKFYKLSAGTYTETKCSVAFPSINSDEASGLVGRSSILSGKQLALTLSEWAKNLS